MLVERRERWWPGPLVVTLGGLLTWWCLTGSPASAQVSPDGPIFTNPGLMCSVTIQGGAFASDWTAGSVGGPVAPTLTFNYGSSPPGSCGRTLRVQLGATGAGAGTYFATNTPPTYAGSQMCSGGTSNISWAFWAKATTTGIIDLCVTDNLNGARCTGTCSLTANTWSFCKVENQPWWVTTNSFIIGNATWLNGGVTRGAIDLEVYAPRCVVAPTISP